MRAGHRDALTFSQQLGEMANADKVELENPPASLKSPVWEHFGFAVTYKDDGQRQVD